MGAWLADGSVVEIAFASRLAPTGLIGEFYLSINLKNQLNK